MKLETIKQLNRTVVELEHAKEIEESEFVTRFDLIGTDSINGSYTAVDVDFIDGSNITLFVDCN